MRAKIYILSVILLVFSFTASAQGDLSMVVGDIPQRNYLNPAFMPRTTYLVIPFIGGMEIGAESSIGYGDILKDHYIDGQQLVKKTKKNNPLALKANLDFISFGVRFRESNMITFSNRIRVAGGIDYPSDIFRFIFDNPVVSSDIFNIKLNSSVMAWNETAVGYTRQIGRYWSVGVKVKYIAGVAALNTNATSFKIDKTVSDYTIQGDVDIMSGNYNMETSEFGTSSIMKNPGVAFDFGGVYASDQGWKVSLAVTDLGFIKWNAENSSRIISRDLSKKYVFKGLGDLNDVFGSASLGDMLDSVYHDMMDAIEVDTLTGTGFTTMMPATLHAGGEYDIRGDNIHNVSLNFLGTFAYKQRFNYSITAGYRYTLPNGRFSAMGALTHKRTDPLALGLGVMANTRGFQFYAATNFSVLALPGCLRNMRSFSLNLGMSVFLGKGRLR